MGLGDAEIAAPWGDASAGARALKKWRTPIRHDHGMPMPRGQTAFHCHLIGQGGSESAAPWGNAAGYADAAKRITKKPPVREDRRLGDSE